MSTSNVTESAKVTCNNILASLAGLGTTWAAYGVKLGQLALEQGAGALSKTAHTLEHIAAEFDKKAPSTSAAASAASAASAAPASPSPAAPQA